MSAPRTLLVLVLATGCSRDPDVPSIARALFENGAALALAVDLDRECGFESTGAEVHVEGEIGALGSATWTIRDCVPAFDVPRASGCDTTRRALAGTARVSGTRTVLGTVTGDPAAPIVPDGPGATSIAIEASLEEFTGEGRADVVTLASADGTLAVGARLWRAMGTGGGCTIPTPNVAVERLTYAGSLDVIDGLEGTVTVEEASLAGVRGRVGERENVLDGTIRIDGRTHDFTAAPLDERYSAPAFVEATACADEVAIPVRHECGAPSQSAATRLAAGAIDALSLVARIARRDPTCGFDAAPPILQAGAGGMMRQIVGCRIDLGAGTSLADGCAPTRTVVSGAVTVTGAMRIEGRITDGAPADVLPSGDGALAFELEEVLFEGFAIERDGRRFVATGVAAGRVEPRLARSEESGLCTVVTPITHVSDVRLRDLIAVVDAPDAHARGVFSDAHLAATVGAWDASENTIVGEATIAGAAYAIEGVLDPHYERASFDDAWQCKGVATTNPFECDATTSIGLDVARASVLAFQTIGALIAADESCGFASAGVEAGARISGPVGSPDGTGIFTVGDCLLAFDEPTVALEDCHGNQVWVEGRAVASGTKTVAGWVTGDPAERMLSVERAGVEYDLSLDLDGLRVFSDEGPLAEVDLTLVHGALAGRWRPRLAIDDRNGACTLITPEAHVGALNLSNADVLVRRGSRTIASSVASSSIDATVGRHDDADENTVSGRIDLDGREVTLEPRPLDRDFDARAFVTGFSCREGMLLPSDDRDCDMRQVLGEVGARLLVQAIGGVTQVAGRDDFDCGFGSTDTLTNPEQVVGELGDPGAIVWEIASCRLGFSQNRQGQPFDSNCVGRDAYFDGSATVTARRGMEGIRDETRGVDYIHPQTPNATRIDYQHVLFSGDFSSYGLAPGESEPEQQMWIHGGSLSGVVEPFMAAGDGSHEAFDEGDFTVPSPLARIRGLAAQAIDATILFDGKRFRVRIDASSIDAFNGSWSGAPGETNDIAGQITIDGRAIELMRGGELNPDYDQAELDASYACAERLLETLPPE